MHLESVHPGAGVGVITMCGSWPFVMVVVIIIVNVDLARKKQNLLYPRHLEPQCPLYTVTVIEMVVKVNIEAK